MNFKSWYFTQGLWEMEGMWFWKAFIFETPFVLLRVLPLFFFLFFASTIGVVIGTFNELFSGIKKILILLALIMIPTLVGLLFQTIDKQITMNILDSLKEILGISSTGLNIWPLVGTLLVLITINLLLSFLMNQKREIKRING